MMMKSERDKAVALDVMARASVAFQATLGAMAEAEGEIARLREALATTDAEVTRLRVALKSLPFEEYGDAQMAGCDPNGAWDVFRAAAARHIRSALAPKEEP